MFESAELGRKVSKDDYEAALPELRTALLKAQTELEDEKFSVVVLVNGLALTGSDTVNRLHEWLDTRYVATEAWSPPSEDERERPEFWRYWSWLPRAGRIGIFLGSWYTRPLLDRIEGRSSAAEFERDLARIAAFERTLVEGGTLFVKLWLHVGKKELERRLRDLHEAPAKRHRITKYDLRQAAHYSKFRRLAEQAVRETSSGEAPWTVIEAQDDRYRNLTAARQLLADLQERLRGAPASRRIEPPAPIDDPATILDTLDFSKRVQDKEYEARMPLLQAELGRLASKLARRKKSAIFVFEGQDAAGKGGAIRRVIRALDAAQYRVIPIAAPTEEERAHHYLWRFWRHLPRRGHVTIYDRSWYGRVLVERVEAFATREEWSRAYKEINDFERELTDAGIVLVKFWLQVTSEEQLRRFQEREREPWKQHKITAEDYRNREKANNYELAAAEMLTRNSTEYAPFTLVPADDKRGARLTVLETICRRLRETL
jgi:AMP-polyphosphate phosphotransferase